MSENEQKRGTAHIPKLEKESTTAISEFLKGFFFDLVILFANTVCHIFFREVRVRNTFNLPKTGPTIVVVAPHANQFVDGAVILTRIKAITNRNSRPIIAESSYKQGFVGLFARGANSIPVPRAQDNLKFVDGEIYIKDGDLKRIYGKGTKFTEFTPKALIGLPESAGNSEIAEIISDTELVLRKPFKQGKAQSLLEDGTRFKYAPKISNDIVFQHVFNALHEGGLIDIFPEGGSHDRPDLLPIKAGFAIMALGAVAADPSRPVQIVPTGLNYFHRNKFRSRAVVEFGTPIKVTAEDGEFYKKNPREAVSKLLEEVTTGLKGVTVTAPDFETLQVIQAARRLYAQKVPLSLSVDMNRRLLIGYTHYKDDPRIIHLKDAVLSYNRDLDRLGLKDHQVELAVRDRFESFVILVQRLFKLVILASLALPGTILFAPIFIIADRFAKEKQKQALAKSVVKIKAVDVIASWKITIATLIAPALYITYSLIGVYVTRSFEIFDKESHHPLVVFVSIYAVLVLTTYAAFRIGEIGMDVFKSLPPLFSSAFGSEKELKKLKQTREGLAMEITELVNDLGPKVFPDFDVHSNKYVKSDQMEKRARSKEAREGTNKENINDISESRGRAASPETDASSDSRSRSYSAASSVSNALSRVNSEGNLSDIPILGDGGSNRSDDGYYSKYSDYEKSQKIDGSKNKEASETQMRLRQAIRKRQQDQMEQQSD